MKPMLGRVVWLYCSSVGMLTLQGEKHHYLWRPGWNPPHCPDRTYCMFIPYDRSLPAQVIAYGPGSVAQRLRRRDQRKAEAKARGATYIG